MTLTKGQIEEAMGRAALVYELLEVERRAAEAASLMDRAEDSSVETLAEGDFHCLTARAQKITEMLWGDGAEIGEKTWQEKLKELSREQALVAIEQVLRRRPEVTPPEDVDSWTVDQMQTWLVEKIAELPEEERSGWTR